MEDFSKRTKSERKTQHIPVFYIYKNSRFNLKGKYFFHLKPLCMQTEADSSLFFWYPTLSFMLEELLFLNFAIISFPFHWLTFPVFSSLSALGPFHSAVFHHGISFQSKVPEVQESLFKRTNKNSSYSIILSIEYK